MLILAIGLFITCTAKDRKSLYVFASLVLFFLLAREVNFGRTLFIFGNPDMPNVFPKWKHMEYGWLAKVGIGLYMVWMLVYFVWRKVWKLIGEVLRIERIPVWNLLFVAGGVVVGVCFESMHNSLSEELGEVVAYVGIVGTLYQYSRSKTRKVGC